MVRNARNETLPQPVLKFIIINKKKASTMTIKVNGGGNGKQRSAQDEARQAFQKREEELAKVQNGGGNGKVRQK